MTNGHTDFLVNVIDKLSVIIGLKFNNFGYISKGDKVPEVIMTVSNFSKIGRMAMEASKQENCKTGS
jgi:hypothetical protein